MEILSLFKWPITFLGALLLIFIFFRKELSGFLKETSWFKTKWFELHRIRGEIFAKAEEIEKLSHEVNKDKSELRKSIRIFIQTQYLALETRNKFPIPEKIAEAITRNLNLLANLAIKNKKEKKEWITKMAKFQTLLESTQR